jgi:chromosome segregation ATPase
MHEREQQAVARLHASERATEQERVRLRNERQGLEGPRLAAEKRKATELEERLGRTTHELLSQRRIVSFLENELQEVSESNSVYDRRYTELKEELAKAKRQLDDLHNNTPSPQERNK